MNRTVAVLGPGAVGGSLAVRLSLAGIRTICVAHEEAAGLIALAGLVVESRDGTLTARTEVTEQLVKPVGLLLVTVKAPVLEEAIERIDPAAVSEGVLWHKLARIAPLAAATAASGRTVGELRHDPIWRPRLEHGIVETCAVAEADGVGLRASAQWAIIDELADETTTSAARDVAEGRRSELDAIVGAVLRAADRLDGPCPTLTELAAAAGVRGGDT